MSDRPPKDQGKVTLNTATESEAQPNFVAPYVWNGMVWEPQIGGQNGRDAFSRLRVSNNETVFESKSIVDGQALLFDDVEVSGASTTTSFDQDRASVAIGVGNAAAGVRVRQSKQRPGYQSGKSHLLLQTFIFGASATGVTRRAGLFDENNGVFLEQDEAGVVSFNIRSNVTGTPVTTKVVQADWNQMSFDDLDLTQAQILVIDYSWLGTGTVRVGFIHDDHLMYLHHFRHANEITSVYMSTPNNPVRWEIEGDGTQTGAHTLETICSSVISEGGEKFPGILRSIDRGITGFTTLSATSIYPIIALRLDSAGLGAQVKILSQETLVTTAADYRWSVVLNPTIVGDALSFTDVPNSGCEAQVDIANGTSITGGTVLGSGYASTSQTSSAITASLTNYSLGALVDGTSDIIVLAVQNITAAVETYFGALSWLEAD